MSETVTAPSSSTSSTNHVASKVRQDQQQISHIDQLVAAQIGDTRFPIRNNVQGGKCW